jgi:hypothetical protein
MIRQLTLADAVIVCSDLRPEDAACVRAVSGREPGEWFAAERWGSYGPAWALLRAGRTLAIGGMTLVNGWTGLLWFVARPGLERGDWRQIVRATRTVLRNATDPANPERRHRIEAHVLHGWAGASRLADHIGLRLEGIRWGAGAGGEAIEVWGLAVNGRKTPEASGQTQAQGVA